MNRAEFLAQQRHYFGLGLRDDDTVAADTEGWHVLYRWGREDIYRVSAKAGAGQTVWTIEEMGPRPIFTAVARGESFGAAASVFVQLAVSPVSDNGFLLRLAERVAPAILVPNAEDGWQFSAIPAIALCGIILVTERSLLLADIPRSPVTGLTFDPDPLGPRKGTHLDFVAPDGTRNTIAAIMREYTCPAIDAGHVIGHLLAQTSALLLPPIVTLGIGPQNRLTFNLGEGRQIILVTGATDPATLRARAEQAREARGR